MVERGKRRLVTPTNPFKTKLTENGIKNQQERTNQQEWAKKILNRRSFPKLISYERSKLPFLNIFFLFMQETVFLRLLKITSTDFRVKFISKVRRIESLSSNELLRL